MQNEVSSDSRKGRYKVEVTIDVPKMKAEVKYIKYLTTQSAGLPECGLSQAEILTIDAQVRAFIDEACIQVMGFGR